MSERLGTAFYIAPEVLTESYGEKCDVWSCGVILHILLSAIPPFNGPNDHEIFSKVRKQDINFNDPVWATISQDAKDFIKRLLTKDPELRPSAEAALKDKWLVNTLKKENKAQPLLKKVFKALDNVKNFKID